MYLSLLRYRINDRNLRIEDMEVGQRTKTDIAVVYISDFANDICVQKVRKRIANINTDNIIESGELQAFLLNSKASLFPEMMVIERSDVATEALMEGKVIVLVDERLLVLAAHTASVEHMYTCDGRYENKFIALFMRMIRYTTFFRSFTALSYWVVIVDFHSDSLPAGFIIALAEARAKVPFSALTGVFLLEFIMKLIREALLRVSTKIGSAIAIVGALIIG